MTVGSQDGTDEVTDTVEVVVSDGGTDPVASTVVATATPAEVAVGGTSEVSVVVSADGASPTGEVTLTGGGRIYGPKTLEGGRAAFTVGPFAEPGTVAFTASYAGDGSVAAGEGTVTVRVVAAPAPGDTTPPDTTITAGPTGAARGPAATFRFASTEAGTYQCSLDGGTWKPCASPATFTRLAQGEHELRVRAVDAAGNVDPTPAARGWTVDRGRPTVRVTPGWPTTSDRTPTVRRRISDRLDTLRKRDVAASSAGRRPPRFG